jgi:hypothetical protein
MFGVCVLAVVLVAAGCTTNNAVSVSLNPNAAQTAGQGVVIPITATVSGDTNSQGVTWTLTGAGALSGSTTTATTYTAPAVINAASMVTVTATSVKDTSKNAPLTINLAPISIGLASNPAPTLDPGKTTAITATLQNDTLAQGVTWALSGTGCIGAACGTLTGATTTTVTYNAPGSVPVPPSVTVTATAVGNGTMNTPLVVNLVAAPAITTTTIANASIAVPYGPAALAETGGVAPFTWSNPNNDLPPGFTLNANTGAVSGTPTQTQNGPFAFSAQVKDALNVSSTVALISVTVGVAATNACGPTLGNESVLKGEYAFYVQGFDGVGAPIALAASFNADGTGKVATGEEDSTTSAGLNHVSLTAASSYVVGPDNRGCVSLVDVATGVKTFRFALGGLSAPPSPVASKGSIIEFDDATGTNSRASGVIRLQTPADFVASHLQANYAFGMDGLDSVGGHYSVGGSFSLNNSTGAITSVFTDIDDAGVNSSALAGGTGSLTLGSLSATTGRIPGSIVPDGTHSYGLAIYIVKGGEFFAITTDTLSLTKPILSGRFIVTGAGFTNASAAGTDLIHVNGTSGSPASPSGTIGILTFTDGAPGTVTGTLYGFDSGVIQTPQVLSGGTAGNYTVGAASGRVALTNVGSNPPAVYLASSVDGISAFIIGSDTSAIFGYAEAQPAAVYSNASISGTYTIGIDQMIDNGVLNFSGAEILTSGSITSGTLDLSGGGGGLTINSAVTPDSSPSFTISSNGSGTWSGFGSATTYVVTNGTKVFILDDNSTFAEIIVLEK